MAQTWDAMATLVDNVRRSLFEYVQRAAHPVSREEAADAIGISRGLAAFHLDKLTDAGLLSSRYQAPQDVPRGRGRTPKVYEPMAGEVAVSVPEREYGLAARVLADAVADAPAARATVGRHARRQGHEIGARWRLSKGGLVDALNQVGYRPRAGRHLIQLTNCPFHPLAQRHTDLICGLNLEFVNGLIDGLAVPHCRARLQPTPGQCCVEIDTARL
jgi:predicted ArsR family transcriptional regulator